jgi:hypothetical protein
MYTTQCGPNNTNRIHSISILISIFPSSYCCFQNSWRGAENGNTIKNCVEKPQKHICVISQRITTIFVYYASIRQSTGAYAKRSVI